MSKNWTNLVKILAICGQNSQFLEFLVFMLQGSYTFSLFLVPRGAVGTY